MLYKKEKVSSSNPNHREDLGVQIHDTKDNMEPNTSSTDINCRFNDNPLYGTQRILGLIARRSESNMTSPKNTNIDYEIKNEPSICVKENELSKLKDTIKTTNVAHESRSKENQETPLSKTVNLNSTISNQNDSSHRNNEGKIIH